MKAIRTRSNMGSPTLAHRKHFHSKGAKTPQQSGREVVNLYPWKFPKFIHTLYITPSNLLSLRSELYLEKMAGPETSRGPSSQTLSSFSVTVRQFLCLFYSTTGQACKPESLCDCYNALEPLIPTPSKPDFHISQIQTPSRLYL